MKFIQQNENTFIVLTPSNIKKIQIENWKEECLKTIEDIQVDIRKREIVDLEIDINQNTIKDFILSISPQDQKESEDFKRLKRLEKLYNYIKDLEERHLTAYRLVFYFLDNNYCERSNVIEVNKYISSESMIMNSLSQSLISGNLIYLDNLK